MGGQGNGDRAKAGVLGGAWRHGLPALLALAPGVGLAGAATVSSGLRQAGRRAGQTAAANVYRLEAVDSAGSNDPFSAFRSAPSPDPAGSGDADADADASDRARRRFLADSGLLAPASERAQSELSSLSHSRRQASAAFDAMLVADFAGKPQFSGVCDTTYSVCTSDIGHFCSVPDNTPCIGPRPPGVNSIVLNGTPAVTATSITFNVMFDEAITAASVSTDDFQVTSVSGTATGSVTGVVPILGPSPIIVLGSPVVDNQFTVTVSSISGNGSIRLDLKANTNIIDRNPNSGLGLAGPFGNGNAGFTAAFSAGTVHTVALNSAPTGAVTISGTVTEDQTLTADTSALADADGLGPFSYQWRRGGVPIVGATASTYVLGDADVGATISVTVSYIDGLGNPESVTSAATAPVANINDAPTGAVTIAGIATENQTLTASNTLADADGLGPIGYQWRRSGVPIVGATANTYVLGDADVGTTISVLASYIDGHGTAESVVSAATAAVANVNDVPTGGIMISGTATENQTLTAVSTLADGDGLGPLNYQWRRDGVPIVGATASSYLLGDADVGAVMSVVVTYTDQQGTAEGPLVGGPTAPVANVNDPPTGTVTISGTATEDQTLTASNTLADVEGLGPIGYQWNRSGVPIVGATATSYLLGDADVGALITVTASYIDGQGTAESVTSAAVGPVANINDLPTGAVTISGTATEDQTLTASNSLADADGLGPISYQWNRGGVPIVGATASSYLLGDADVGALITVTASYTDGQGTPESVTSTAVGPVANINDVPTGGITISGTATEDQTLTAVSTLADGDGLGPLNYQWRRDGVPIVGATASSYLLGDADVGAVMSVVVTYTDQQGTAEGPLVGGPTAPVANVNDPPTGTVTISGTATEDQTLTASNTLADVEGLGPIGYQWNRSGVPIVGATATSYLLGDADVGALITVTASYIDGQGTAESVTSAAVGPVANINDLPTGAVTISGTATEDQTLTASNTLADADGLGPISYQWNRGGVPIVGATGSGYLLGDADVGAQITVTASYTDGQGTPESVTSTAVGPVANINDVPTGGITISGTVTEDQTLTATSTLADGDGLGPLNYQWRRDGVPIVGATASSYLLGDADVGAAISVAVNYTDQQGTAEGPLVGGPTAPVANVNDPPGGTVSIQGTAQSGQQLTVQNTLTDADGLGPFSYQWNRNGVPIVGANAATYFVGDADVGAAITVTVSYTDGNGTAESVTSAPLGPVLTLRPVPGPGAFGLGLLALLAGWAGWRRLRPAR